MAAEVIAQIEGDEFNGAQRDIEVKGTDKGVLHISVRTRYGNTINDTSMIALTCEELEQLNEIVNG